MQNNLHINENSLCSIWFSFDLMFSRRVNHTIKWIYVSERKTFKKINLSSWKENLKKHKFVNLLLNSEMFKYLIHWTGDVAIEFRTLHWLELADFFMVSSTLKFKHTKNLTEENKKLMQNNFCNHILKTWVYYVLQ